MSQVATLLVVVGVLGLFWLDRDRKTRTSPMLWIPVVWLSIAGSRPLSSWLQINSSNYGAAVYEEGSPFDRNFWLTLVLAGLLVMVSRRKAVFRLIRANTTAFAFLLFCALSILWSDYPDVAFKRWVKFLGDYIMVLIVLTDRAPLAALKRVLAWVAFLLLPSSILLIKYYPYLGRSYALHWVGTQYYTGVASDKNMLGMTCLVLGLGGAWETLHELAGERRTKVLLVHGTVFTMALWLLILCNSVTSLSCFVLATLLMAAHTFFRSARRPMVVHIMVASALFLCFAPLFLGMGGGLISSLGRDPTLTGRTQLWKDVLSMHVNPFLGAGFESFWLGSRLQRIWQMYWWQPIEAHNGYIETYINLGVAGLGILLLLIGVGYRNIVALLRQDPEAGRIRLAYFLVGVAYNLTEAAIHTQSMVWIFSLLSMMALPYAAERKAITRRVPIEKERAVLAPGPVPVRDREFV
jgi:exopolysaccharide production protein ExoQ